MVSRSQITFCDKRKVVWLRDTNETECHATDYPETDIDQRDNSESFLNGYRDDWFDAVISSDCFSQGIRKLCTCHVIYGIEKH